MVHNRFAYKLKAYSILASSIVGSTTALQADVIYTDIDPEVELPITETEDYVNYTLSLNGDSSASFYFLNQVHNQYLYIDYEYVNSTMFNYFLVRGLYGGSIAGVFTGGLLGNVASMFDSGATLGPDNNWIQPISSWYYGAIFFVHDHKHFPDGTISDTFSTGVWLGATDKYVGLRFTKDDNFHYGWVRLSIDATTRTPTLTGFAYESEPNISLKTGTEQIAIQNLFTLKGNVYIEGQNIYITMDKPLDNGSRLKIISLDGKVLMTRMVNGSEIQLEQHPYNAGVYFITIHSSEGDFIHKMILN